MWSVFGIRGRTVNRSPHLVPYGSCWQVADFWSSLYPAQGVASLALDYGEVGLSAHWFAAVHSARYGCGMGANCRSVRCFAAVHSVQGGCEMGVDCRSFRCFASAHSRL